MYPITNAVKALFDAEQRKVLRITGVDGSGNPIVLDDSDVVEGSFSIDRYSCNGEKLEIGTAISSELSLKLDNLDGRFDSVVFEGVELFVEIGIADWSEDDPKITWVPCGYFTPYDQPRRLSVITIKALDRMTRFDVVEAARVEPWTTNTGAEVQTSNTGEVIYFVYELALPTTVRQLVKQCANRMDIPFTQDISAFPNANMTVAELPVLKQDITFRNLIQWCAGLMASNAWIDWNGELRFSWYDNATSYVSTLSNRFSSDLYETPLVITGVRFQDTDDENTVYVAGSDSYALDVSDNCFITPANASTVLTNIYNKVHDFAYTPFTASVIAAPYLWPMDRMVFTDKDDNGHVSLLTNVNFNLNGTTEIKAIGESAELNSYASTGSFTARQAKVLENIVTPGQLSAAVDHATEMITGGLGGYVILNVNETTRQTEEILIMDNPDKNLAVNVWRFNQGGLGHSSNGYSGPFNDVALTADGKINANMITTGTLNADIIRSGTISDYNGNNSWNLTTGALTMTGGTIDIGDFEVDSTGKLTCTGADISGELHTVDTAGTYYIDVANGQISAGKITNGTKTESGALSFVDTEDASHNVIPGVLLTGNAMLIETTNKHIEINSSDYIAIRSGNFMNIVSDAGLKLSAPSVVELISNQQSVQLKAPTVSFTCNDFQVNNSSGVTGGYWSWIWGSSWNTNQPVYLEFINGICVSAHY